MAQYTVTLSDAEDKALGIVAVSQQEWIDNVVHERCRVAMDEIVQSEVKRLLAAGEPIPPSVDEIVMQAPIKSAAERNEEAMKGPQAPTPKQ
jgi:hypothetical protein